MSWAEVKKINSNLDVPLNEYLEYEYGKKGVLIFPNSSNASTGTGRIRTSIQCSQLTSWSDYLSIIGKGVIKYLNIDLGTIGANVMGSIRIEVDGSIIEDVSFPVTQQSSNYYGYSRYRIHSMDAINVGNPGSGIIIFQIPSDVYTSTVGGGEAVSVLMDSSPHTFKPVSSSGAYSTCIVNTMRGIPFNSSFKVSGKVSNTYSGKATLNYTAIYLD